MAKGKLSPRQKMINLMYLVFIAMLAMQIDREVLRSFEEIDSSLLSSSGASKATNDAFVGVIAERASKDQDYKAVLSNAKEVQKQSQDLYQALNGIKTKLDAETGYALPKPGEEINYNALQDVDKTTNLMFVGGKQSKPSKTGNELVAKIDAYREFMLSQYSDEADKSRINQFFSTGDDWLRKKFYNQPMIAAKAFLSKLQSDLRTEEGNVLRSKLTTKMLEDIEINTFTPIVTAPRFLRKGEDAQALVALGAYDNSIGGTASLNIGSAALSNGKAVFKLPTGTVGKQSISGSLIFVNPESGKKETLRIENIQYEVVEETLSQPPTGAVITADKMNVVYRGLPNPISAIVNGVDGGVTLSLIGGSGNLSGGNGKYTFTPGGGSTVKFRASGKTSSGQVVSGEREFRIKNVPPATGMIRGKTSETMPASSLARQTITVAWPDFLFDVTGTVTSFKVKVPGLPTKVVNGSDLGAAGGILDRAKKGDAVNIFDIKYSSNNGGGQGEASPVAIEIR